jgi:CubicO group peptidase (beta-lactamase class C family)
LAGGWSTPISSIIRDDFVLQDEWSTAHITLDDAVSHRTGMPGHDNSWHREINGTQATIRDIVRNGRNLPYTVAPRTSWHYCNYMFITLSHVIEVLTGQWLGQVLQELIWDPLGMSSTYMDLDKAKDSSAHLATSYVWRNDEEKYDELPYLGVKEINGAGGVISNVLDYSKWLRCLINETEPFSKAVHNDIKTPRFIANSQPGLESDVSLYSLGWIRTTIHGQVVYWHSGSTATFGALVYWLPDLHYGIVAFGNGALVSKEVELVLVRKLLEDKLQIPVQDRPDINKLWVLSPDHISSMIY